MTGRRSFLAGGACAAVCAAVRPFAARAADALPALPECYADYLPQVAAKINALKSRTADGVTAVIANAVTGFWYAWEAADAPTGPFAQVGDPVRASLDGELVMPLAEPIRFRRFYRLRVSGRAH